MLLHNNITKRLQRSAKTKINILSEELEGVKYELKSIPDKLEHFRDGQDVYKDFMQAKEGLEIRVKSQLTELERTLGEFYQETANLIRERNEKVNLEMGTAQFNDNKRIER
jgi:chromosome segregation ATPase